MANQPRQIGLTVGAALLAKIVQLVNRHTDYKPICETCDDLGFVETPDGWKPCPKNCCPLLQSNEKEFDNE